MSERLRTLMWSVLLVIGVTLCVVQLHEDDDHHREGHGHSHSHSAQGPTRLFAWEPEAVARLEFEAGNQEVVFERSGEGWKQIKPQDSGASVFDADAYVALFSQARRDREFETPESSLQTFGLGPEALHVVVRGKQGEELANMNVGELTPDGFGRYVHMGGGHVLIVPRYQFERAFQLFR